MRWRFEGQVVFLSLNSINTPMSGFRILKTEEFDKDYAKLDKSEQKRVDKILRQLMESGDP